MLGIVAIGRNEGERLVRCLDSVNGLGYPLVYVDSGSSDDSVKHALSFGCEVVELDMSIPFTAARARNSGFDRLIDLNPTVEFVFFVDGDCEVVAAWLGEAVKYLVANPNMAAVCGRRQERFPERSVFNLMCDSDWDLAPGPVKLFGGDVVIRVDAFKKVAGFREDLIAGEEPELAVRIRSCGWQLYRLPSVMTIHDANMIKFSQWWKRAKRGGYAYTEGAFIHGAPPERHFVRQSRRITIWGGVIPLAILIAGMVEPILFLLLLIYPLQVFRIARKGRKSPKENLVIAFFLVVGRFAEMQGQFSFWLDSLMKKKRTLIEYK